MNQQPKQNESYIYKCEVYNSLPDKIIEEFFVNATSQIEAKTIAIKKTTKTNILLITAQKIEII
jgi:hypothetical protein